MRWPYVEEMHFPQLLSRCWECWVNAGVCFDRRQTNWPISNLRSDSERKILKNEWDRCRLLLSWLVTKPLYVDRAPFSTEEPARRLADTWPAKLFFVATYHILIIFQGVLSFSSSPKLRPLEKMIEIFNAVSNVLDDRNDETIDILKPSFESVSYTHLTLPTKLEV